jgi:glutamate synthase domain-containing protein 3
MGQPPPAACGFDDCAQVPVLRLEGSHFANGTIAISTDGSTLQFVGAVLEGSYVASGNTITLDGTAQAATCDGDRLSIGSVVYHAACPQLAGALDASRSDSWSPQPVSACM